MEFKIEKQILKRLKRLLFLLTAVAFLILIYYKFWRLSLILIAFFFLLEKFMEIYFKSWEMKIEKEKITLKKGVILKQTYFIPRSRALLVYKFKTVFPNFRINILIIKGTGFMLSLIPCSDEKAEEILRLLK